MRLGVTGVKCTVGWVPNLVCALQAKKAQQSTAEETEKRECSEGDACHFEAALVGLLPLKTLPSEALR